MLTKRLLPADEWDKLVGTEMEGYAPHMDPKRSVVIAVERDGELVACVGMMFVLNAHGLWKKDQQDNAEVWQLLFDGLNETAAGANVQAVMTGSKDARMTRFLKRNGATELPMEHYALAIPFGPFVDEAVP